ncbi:hypothetical protein [Caulobacter rhizosphaerae]|jgi:hypothetical protein|uniref:hypothetical protein n=1 Tax=Caulobacter rhizosphaerae TaxID=2010972 RepID=UPI0013D20B64|nr:hypothetical protein [Caulobacter rhizosphaerae]GGL14123.1 hypothetical protein GCM10010983_09290 [Caulobacter rhizosphaerae]
MSDVALVGDEGEFAAMHPFPPTSELQFLVGLEISQICLDPWSTQVRFSDGGRITVEGPFEHLDAQGRPHLHQTGDEQDIGPIFLRDLLQKRVVMVQRDANRLTIAFDSGAILRLWSEAIPYESGQIHPPGREHEPIVF